MRVSAERGRPLLIFGAVAAAAFALDQGTKILAVAHLDPGSFVPLLGGWLRLNLTHNVGSAFGLIRAGTIPLAASALVCVVILGYVFRGGLVRAPGRSIPLGLVVGGALGNLLDRVRTGGVVDFIDLQVWPVFNIADAAITIGVGLLAIGLARRR
jgi:signal peptidase II